MSWVGCACCVACGLCDFWVFRLLVGLWLWGMVVELVAFLGFGFEVVRVFLQVLDSGLLWEY